MENKTILLDGNVLCHYRIRYSRRAKYVRLQYTRATGLELIIPGGMSALDAEKFIHSKRDWIKKHAVVPAKQDAENSLMYFLGKCYKLRENGRIPGRLYRIEIADPEIIISRPPGGEKPLNELLDNWLEQRAHRYLPDRVRTLAERHGFSVGKISIRGQKTRWGSCSKNRNLSFNYRLMAFREEVIDYVIIHELCHTKQMNHSRKFWSLVEKIVPDYMELRRELKRRE